MKTVGEMFGVDSFTMASVGPETSSGVPESKKITPSIVRVPLIELEQVFIKDALVFNGINKIKQTIMQAQHTIKAKDPKVQKYFDDFVENLGNSGGGLSWEFLLGRLFTDEMVYGRAWIENIYNVMQNRIVDWDLIDSKSMDYAKDHQLRIVLDMQQKPVGYTQTLPYGQFSFMEMPKQIIPPKVRLMPNQIFIEPKRIAQVKLFTFGDSFYGMGLIEPIYLNSIRKQNVEEALANAIWRHGFPIVWAALGDLQHEPTPQQVQTMLDKLKNLTFKKEIATPYYYNLQILESKKPTKLQEHLSYFVDAQVAGLGIPKPYVMGSGEATNRATLSNMSDIFQLSLRDIIQSTCDAVRRYMFKPVCEFEGFSEVPTLDFDMVGIDEIDRKSKRITDYIKAGILTPDDKISDYIKKVEDLDD
jgi:hypothetical protein